MNGRRRLLVDPVPPLAEPGREDIIWSTPPGESSLHTNLDPRLGLFGDVPAANRDAVWLATLVFIADRTLRRPRGWSRTIDLDLPASDPDVWNGQTDTVAHTLDRLTSDAWAVTFRPHEDDIGVRSQGDGDSAGEVDMVCLLSGGADSLSGAIRALDEGHRPLFVSHWDASVTAGSQNDVIQLLEARFGADAFEHVKVRVGAAKEQVGGRVRFPDEYTRRSRSLLFVTLGLAAAAARGSVPLWIPENGYASLNPPLTLERMGALSTRTTDPLFLQRTSELLAEVGAHADLTNPYADATKGEMFSEVADRIGKDDANRLLRQSHSCAHQRLPMQYGHGPSLQCGACFGCLVRRAAFAAANLTDRTDYLVTTLDGDQLDDFLERHSQDYKAVRHAVARGVTPADVLSLTLPDGYDRDQAGDLMRRGLAELSAVELG